MRRLVFAIVLLALVSAGLAVPAGAGPPDRETVYEAVDFPDFENNLVIFFNTTRDAICTPEQIDAEFALAEWFALHAGPFFQWLDEHDGDPTGFPGVFPPDEPERPAGIVAGTRQIKETGQGALVESIHVSNAPAEVWHRDPTALDVGPCTDTLDQSGPYAVGTANGNTKDNDVFGSDTRGNSFGQQIVAHLVTDSGDRITYNFKFHVNKRCHGGEFAPPSCLIERHRISGAG